MNRDCKLMLGLMPKLPSLGNRPQAALEYVRKRQKQFFLLQSWHETMSVQQLLVKVSRSYDNLKSGKEIHNAITLSQR